MARSFTPAPPNATNHVASIVPGFPPPVDVAELLPPPRRSLLLDLRQRGEDAMNLVRPLLDRIDELRTERHLLSARIKTLKTPRGQGGANLDDDDTSVVDAKRKRDAIDAEMARLGELIELRRAVSRNRAALVQSLEGWLQTGRPSGTAIVAAAEVDIATIAKRGEAPMTALDRLRQRLRELDADAHRVRSAPFPAAHAKARARAMIEQLAARGTPDASALVEADLDIGWPMVMQRLGLAGIVAKTGDQLAGNAMAEIVDMTALFAWLHKDALIARIEQEIDGIADDTSALSPQDREQCLAQIDADRLAIERQEAALVWRLQADGLPVEHRTDADARAVLAVDLIVDTAEAAAPYGLAARALRHAAEVIGLTPGDQS